MKMLWIVGAALGALPSTVTNAQDTNRPSTLSMTCTQAKAVVEQNMRHCQLVEFQTHR